MPPAKRTNVAVLPTNVAAVTELARAKLPTKHGVFQIVAFFNAEGVRLDDIALIRGDVTAPGPVAVRVHSECVTGDVLGRQGDERSEVPGQGVAREEDHPPRRHVDGGHRAGVDPDALEPRESGAHRLGDDRLDRVTVAHGDPDRRGAVLGLDLRVEAPDGPDDPVGHLGEGLGAVPLVRGEGR